MKPGRTIIIGAGAQAKYACEILCCLEEHPAITVIASEGSDQMDWPLAYQAEFLIGFDQVEKILAASDVRQALVCIANNQQKSDISAQALALNVPMLPMIHPRATIASTATIGEGTIINAGAVIQPFATIGKGVMVHANVIVEHDCIIEDYTNLAPGVSLAGWVHVEKGATIFTGSSVIPGCRIGAESIVGAGSAVIGDVPQGCRVAGTPARKI